MKTTILFLIQIALLILWNTSYPLLSPWIVFLPSIFIGVAWLIRTVSVLAVYLVVAAIQRRT